MKMYTILKLRRWPEKKLLNGIRKKELENKSFSQLYPPFVTVNILTIDLKTVSYTTQIIYTQLKFKCMWTSLVEQRQKICEVESQPLI